MDNFQENFKRFIKENKTYIDPIGGKEYSEESINQFIMGYKEGNYSPSQKRLVKKFLQRIGVDPSKIRKESYWKSTKFPKVKSILNKIDAPNDWKKAIVKYEKSIESARGVLMRTGKWERAVRSLDGLWNTFEITGNPAYASGDHQYRPYWIEYFEEMYGKGSGNYGIGDSYSLDIGDQLS